MSAGPAGDDWIGRLQRPSLIVGAVALALTLLGGALNLRQFYQSYLLAYIFWLGLSLGAIGIVMLHHLVGGLWGFTIRRLLEAGSTTLVLMAVLFLPILFGIRELYPWARPETMAHDPVLQAKSLYLNVPFFIVRAAIYFAVWIILGFLLRRWSLQQDRTAEPVLAIRMATLSGPGLVLLFLTASFAAIDWLMSLEPDWYSTIYGAMVVTGQALATLAMATALATLLIEDERFALVAGAGQFQDLGNLMLAFVMLWAYMSFSQFLIVWSGNLTDEIPWYLHRLRGGWQWIGLGLIMFHFFLPFFALLFRWVKRSPRSVRSLAIWILAMHYVTIFWLIAPAPVFGRPTLGVSWLDLVAPIGIGGLWLGVLAWSFKAYPMVPLHDPRLEAALLHASEATA